MALEQTEMETRKTNSDDVKSGEATPPASPDNDLRERSLSFQDSQMSEIDLRLPRRLSFKKESNEVLMENTRLEDVQLSPADLKLAATLIRDARHGRNMNFKTDEKSVRAYILYSHRAFEWVQVFLILILMGLAMFEKPAMSWLALDYWWTMAIEMPIMLYFLLRFFHHHYFEQPIRFWKDPKNATVFILIFLTIIDMMCYCIWVTVAASGPEVAVRWSRPLRPLFLINFPEGRQIRKAFRNIRRTLPDISYVLVLFLMSIALFALMALKLFQKRHLTYPDGTQYFTDYFDGFWDLYVLVTTANNPDVMMPAYEASGLYAWFFIAYLLVNLYIFMSIVLAVVYNNYRKHLKDEVRCSVYLKRRVLGRAFEILKVWSAGRYVVTRERWYQVMRIVVPGRSDVTLELLLYVLDEDGDSCITREEFLKLADLLNVPLTEVKDRMTFLDSHCSPCYNSRASEMLKKAVKHRFFRYGFDFLILVNAFCIAFNLEESEWFFLSLFLVEIALKLYTYGPVKFFHSFWNVFDLIVVLAALFAILYESGLGSADTQKERTLDFILVLRVLRLVRLMNSLPQQIGGFHVGRFRVTLTTIVNIGPSIFTYGCVIFVIFYIYAIIGMELFSGLITFHGHGNLTAEQVFCGNPKLNGSEFFIKRYCKNNFNDIAKSIVLLFELMVVNQWHVLTDGFVLVTNKAARIYFISFHLIVVIILLNIFTAFVLEAFLLEYQLSNSILEDATEKKIKDLGLFKGQKPVGRKKKKKQKSDKIGLVADAEEEEAEAEAEAEATEAARVEQTISLKLNGVKTTPKPDADSAVNEAVDGVLDRPPQTPITPGTPGTPIPGFNLENGLRFKLKKSGAKKIEVLLQHMFEGEIDPTDEGPDENLEGFQFPEPTELTLNTVA